MERKVQDKNWLIAEEKLIYDFSRSFNSSRPTISEREIDIQ